MFLYKVSFNTNAPETLETSFLRKMCLPIRSTVKKNIFLSHVWHKHRVLIRILTGSILLFGGIDFLFRDSKFLLVLSMSGSQYKMEEDWVIHPTAFLSPLNLSLCLFPFYNKSRDVKGCTTDMMILNMCFLAYCTPGK